MRARSRRHRTIAPLTVTFIALLIVVTASPPTPLRSAPAATGRIPPFEHAAHTTEGIGFDPHAEVRLLELLNRTRMHAGIHPLVMTQRLRTIARGHSRDMALGGYAGHDALDREPFNERLSAALRRFLAVGENVAVAQTADEAHRALLASPPHLRNILKAGFHQVGIGIVAAGSLGLIITEDFSQ